MQIHIPTLLLALLMGFLLLTLQLAAAQRRGLQQQQPALRIWTQGSGIVLLGLALLGARVVIPYWLSVLLGNGAIAVGLVFYHRALAWHLLERAPARWSAGLLILGLAWLALALFRGVAAPALAVGVSLLFAVLLLPSVRLLLRHGWRAEAALRPLALTLAVAGGAMLLRAADAWLRPAEYMALMSNNTAQGLTFLVGFISLLGSGFGFVLACFERMARRMQQLAALDGLTGCLNRSTTDSLLAHTLERGRRDGTPVAFAVLDLDFFKQINDAYGHQAGDTALRAFAAEARARLRGSDVLGRIGGEEFGIILPATDGPGALRLIEAVRESVQALELLDAQGRRIALTVSAGIAVAAPDEGALAEQLYARADAALYLAKSQGRNRVLLGCG